ncbi:hypothetical protein LJB76_03000 [Clostridia bacterium OttesenSCG-928-O13]|nr:hypothetical protein [Clostridia bacterium OttesenSCG-928-O13]
MLGKLIKYDLVYNWKLFVAIMAVLLCWGIVGASYSGHNQVTLTLNMIMMPVLLACVVLCVVSVLQYYNKSLFGRQGYFTMALPTTPWRIVLAKAITTTIWFNALAVAAAFSVGLYSRELGDFFKSLIEMGPDVFRVWLVANLSMLNTLLGLYLVITLANVWVRGRRLGIVGGIAGYVVWAVLQNIGSRVLSSSDIYLPGLISLFFGYSAGFTSFTIQCVYYLVFCLGAYFLNVFLMNKYVSLR